MEQYKIIQDFENYEVSNLGNIRNKKTGKILKPRIHKGYYDVNLSKNNKSYRKTVHRLIAESFIDNPENKPYVDHINGDKLNNNINNLRYATNQENQRNAKLSIKNTSSVKGVSFHKRDKKWQAQITIDGIKVHLGYYDNIEDAKQARITKAQQAFGVYINSCEN